MSSRLRGKLLILAIFLVASIPYWPFKVDDAYISFVYAGNLAAGHGLTYNGLTVEGYSNFLWTILLAPFLALHIDPMWAARGLSIVSAVLGLFIVYDMIAGGRGEGGGAEAWIAVMSAGIISFYLGWTFGGLETIFLAFLIVLFIYSETHKPASRGWLSPLLLLAIALTRPEGVMLFPIWVFHRLVRGEDTPGSLVKPSLVFVAPFSLFLLWRVSAYGYLLPNTAYLKLHPSLDTVRLAAVWLLDFVRLRPAFAVVLLVGVGISIHQRRRLQPEVTLAGLVVLAFLAFVLYSGGDWMPYHRFLAPIVPLLAFPVATALTGIGRRWVGGLMITLAVAGMIMEVGLSLTLSRPLNEEFGRYTDGLIQAGKWVSRNTAPGDTIAVVDSGALPFYAQRPTVDILGLNNTHIAHTPDNIDLEYVFAQKPSVIQLHAGFTESGELLQPTDEDVNGMIIDDPEFQACYRPDFGRPDDPFYPFMFIRTCP